MLTNLNLSLSGENATTVWQWGTNALNIQTVNASGSTAPVNATIHAGVGEGSVKLKNINGGSNNDTLAIDPLAFAQDGTLTINLGNGDDILAFDGALPTSHPFTFDNSSGIVRMHINGGDGNDQIDIGAGGIATGGKGNDTFVIRSNAGPSQPTTQIIINDFETGTDIIDLSKVSNLTLSGSNSLEVHSGGKTGGAWGTDPQGTDHDTLIQLSGGSGTQLILTGAHDAQATVALRVTETQSGFTGITEVLINITDDSVIDARSYDNGVLMSGGSGQQTLISSGHHDFMRGGTGDDTFVITSVAGPSQPTTQIVILDYGSGNDVIDLSSVQNLKLNGPDGDRLEVHEGGKTGEAWGTSPQGTSNDILIQLSGGSGTQLILTGAHNDKTTVAMKVTEEQAGLGTSATLKDFLVNITDNGIVDATASSYSGGAILAGGGGSQTLKSSSGNDFMQGGGGADTFEFAGNFGIDVILDYKQGEDVIDFGDATPPTKNADLSTVSDLLNGNYSAIGSQLTSFLGTASGTTKITVYEDASNNALILIGDHDDIVWTQA